jgi:hypothetical protein
LWLPFVRENAASGHGRGIAATCLIQGDHNSIAARVVLTGNERALASDFFSEYRSIIHPSY